MSAGFTPRGFGGRTFTANGRTIMVEPAERRKENGSTSITLGFPFATLEDYVEPDTVATDLAEYLSCPKRAAAPELYEALGRLLEEFVDPQQGLEQFDSAITRKAVELARVAHAKARAA